MAIFYNKNKININKIDINYRKIKIKQLIINNKFIILLDIYDKLFIKNILLNYKIPNLILKKKYIKSLFSSSNFLFLEGESFFCIFSDNIINFLDIINYLQNKEFIYIYKKSLSNYVLGDVIINEYRKYNNYFFLHFIFIRMRIKIIILLFLFSFFFVKNIK